jgi:signal transduction histidine kinase
MKLFAKYSRINVLATVIIFLVASIAFYFTLRAIFINQIDEDLKIEQKEIETYVKEHNRLPESISVNDQLIHYEFAADLQPRYFSTKQITSPGDSEKDDYRQLVFGITADKKTYKITVSKTMEEAEGLTQSIFIIAFATILLILLATFIINRIVLKRIWKPFYKSLETVKDFKLGATIPLRLPFSSIDEFTIMNETLQKFTSRAQLVFQALKTFSENASHEIQTPLAVIRSKLDLLNQDEKLTEKQRESLQAAYNSVQKLARLNQSLLLLAKIDNNQFDETVSINLREKLLEKIVDFQELWDAQQISSTVELNKVVILINRELLEILLNNLLGNATRHNYNGGSINITLSEVGLTVSNSSLLPGLEPGKLYQRFSKATNGSDSNGLGLSIIKQICDKSGLQLDYRYESGKHVFFVEWQKNRTSQNNHD